MKILDETWQIPYRNLSLATDEVHIWRANLNRKNGALERFKGFLAENEIKRANRYYFDRDRKRFIVKQAVLRMILGLFYLDCGPHAISFGTNQYGKPYLKWEFYKGSLFFNVSDSNQLALFAFARNSKIGIDVEFLRTLPDATEIAAQFFTKEENIALQALSQHRQKEAFFNCWTRKEAFIKATGKGLNYPLDQFAVSLTPNETARLISIENDHLDVDDWSLVSMVPKDGYIGALAVKTKNPAVKFWTFPD